MSNNSKAHAKKERKAALGFNAYNADIEDIVLRLANKELERKANSGKTEFAAIVVKVLTESSITKEDRQILTDLFLNDEYAIDRENNLTYASNTNKKVAFLHIPALFSYVTSYTRKDSKKNDVTTSDLFLFPVVTSLDLSPQQQVKVTFGDLEDFRDIRIIPPPASEKKKKVKKDTKGSIENLVVLMNAREACTKLQNSPPVGSKISSKSFVNPTNPLVGYSGFYGDYIKDILTSDNLRRRTILTLGSEAAKSQLFKPAVNITPLTSNNLEKALIAEAAYASFKVEFLVGSQKIKQFIEAGDTATIFKNVQSIPVKEADSDIKGSFDFSKLNTKNGKEEGNKKDRSIYLKIIPLNAAKQKPDSKLKSPSEINSIIISNLKDYIAGVTRNKYNYSFEEPTDSSQNVFAIDIFGKTTDEQLLDGTVDTAIDYSKVKKGTAQPQPGVLQPIMNFFKQQPKKNPTPTAAGKESTATPNQELNACGDSNKLINQNAYLSLESDKRSKQTSYSKDNVLFTKFYQASLALGITDIAEAAIRSQEPSEADMKKFSSKVFSYEAQQEVISVIQEGKEVKRQKKNKKLSTGTTGGVGKENKTGALNIGRGTNLQQIQKNTQNLINFVKSFRKFIAQNEGIPETSVVLLPLSTFRRFVDVKKLREGIDQNSRHFFNRAIDFVVYINNDPNFNGFNDLSSIPIKDTFEIPNYIVYVYLLKFIKQNGAKFGQSGIGLLEKSQKRKTGYIHYEIMSDYKEPEKGVQRAKRERRWVSQPQDSNKESVYKQAFDKNDKDAIITRYTVKKLESQLTANLPEKFMRILK